MVRNFSRNPLRVLHVAKWYPNHNDVQNGVFIQKHIQATAQFAEVKVLAWLAGDKKTVTRESHENSLAVTRTWFKKKTAISVKRHAFRQYIHSHYNNKALPDVIHLHVFSPDLLVVVFWARKKNIPVVISEHWSGYMRGVFESMPYWRKWAYRRLGKVNRILPVSNYLQKNMQRCGIQGSYLVVPNVVESNHESAKKKANFSFVMVADLVDEIKNVSGVIAAFDKVASEFTTIELHIIGGGPDERMLHDFAKTQIHSSRIHFHGRLANNEVKKQLPHHHCLIINSRVESFGVVLLEAHAAWLPVITTKCGGPEEWIEEGDLSIPINDTPALVKAMKARLNDTKTYEFTKWQACQPEEVASQLQNIYLSVYHEEQKKQAQKAKRKKRLKN